MRFDAAVLRAIRIGDARFRLPEAFGNEQGRVKPLGRQVRNDCVSASLGQIQIVLFCANRVGMPVDLELFTLKPRVLQRLGELIQILLCCFRQFVGIEFEIEEQVEMRLRRSSRLSRLLMAVGRRANANAASLTFFLAKKSTTLDAE